MRYQILYATPSSGVNLGARPEGRPRAWPPLGFADQEQLYGMYWSVAIAAASGVDVIRSLVFIQSP
jgi:hypothetical protein